MKPPVYFQAEDRPREGGSPEPSKDGPRALLGAQGTAHGLFEEQVARTPEAPALLGRGWCVSYRALNARANQVARCLQARGVGSSTLVALCLEPGIGLVTGLLAILKAGGAYVPLDPYHLEARAGAVLDDARPSLVLTSAELGESLRALDPSAAGLALFCPDDDAAVVNLQATGNLAVHDPNALVHVVYTSGSTGRPKGVLGTHRGEANRLEWMRRRFPYGDEEVGCLKTSVNLIDCFSEIFWPLTQGRPLVIAGAEQARDPRQLLALLGEYGVTRLVAVPSLLRALVEGFHDLGQRLEALTLCMSCGEPLSWSLAQAFGERMPHCQLINLYGSTEACADVSYYVVPRDVARWPAEGRRGEGFVPIGGAVDGMSLALVDEAGQEVAAGETGELLVRGPGVARGYLRRPALSAERFCLLQPAGPALRTGDLARQGPDGALELLGRVDQLIKLRGFRIEPGEIEAALCASAEITEAVVIAREDPPLAKRLVAYVVAGAAVVDPVALKARLRQALPSHMVPAQVVILEALPRTPGGKVLRRGLPAPPLLTGHSERGAPSAPGSPFLRCASASGLRWRSLAGARSSLSGHSERGAPVDDDQSFGLVRAVWREVLGCGEIARDADFFELGGDSLSALKMLLAVESRAGVSVGRAFFDDPTAGGLVKLLDGEGVVSRALRGRRDEGAQLEDKVAPPPADEPLLQRMALWLRRAPEGLALRLPPKPALRLLRGLCRGPLGKLLYRPEAALIRRFFTSLEPGGEPQDEGALLERSLLQDIVHRRMEKACRRATRHADFVRILGGRRKAFWRPYAAIAAGVLGAEELLEEHYVLHGLDELEAARAKGRGVIVLTYHMPLFRLAMPALYRLGFPAVTMAALPRGPKGEARANDRLSPQRSSAELAHEIFGTLAAGGLVVIAGEGRKGRSRREVAVCGRVYPLRTGFADLALRSGAVVLPFSADLAADDRVALTFHPPIPRGDRGQPRRERAGAMVEHYGAFLAESLRRSPESLTLRRMLYHLGLPGSR